MGLNFEKIISINTYCIVCLKQVYLIDSLSDEYGFLLNSKNRSSFKNYEEYLRSGCSCGLHYPQHSFQYRIGCFWLPNGRHYYPSKSSCCVWWPKYLSTKKHTIEKQVLYIAIALEEFWSLLLCAKLFIYSDYNNKLCQSEQPFESSNGDFQEYSPTILCHDDNKMFIAETFMQFHHCNVLLTTNSRSNDFSLLA